MFYVYIIISCHCLCIFIYISICWKSGTSDLMAQMLLVLQCTDYEKCFLTQDYSQMNRGHKMRPKRNLAESSGCHDRHPLPRVCVREPGIRNVITDNIWRDVKWYVTMHNSECLLVKNCCQDYVSRWLIKWRTQYNTKTGPQTDEVRRILCSPKGQSHRIVQGLPSLGPDLRILHILSIQL